jgi:OmpA-OmpF porin, OOP family
MASNLVDSLSALVTPDVVGRTASSLGESTVGIAKATTASFSSLLAGLLTRSSNPASMDQIYRLVSNPANDGRVLNNVGGLVSNVSTGAPTETSDLGHRFLSQIFGGQIGGVSGALGQYAGIRDSSASTLLDVAAPLVLGQLGRVVRTEGLNAAGLRDVLSSQRDSIMRNVPAGLSSLVAVGAPARPLRTVEPERDREIGGRPSWIIPAVLALIALLAWWMLRPRTLDRSAGNPPTGTAARVTDTQGVGLTSLTLPNGQRIQAAANGTESALLAFVRDPARPVNASTWFDFDRLRFEAGSARITPDSRPQLANIASILGAYPNVRARIGGWADNAAVGAANARLPQERAESVRNELIALGVGPSRLTTEGLTQAPTRGNDATTNGHASKATVALQVTAK